MDGLGAIPGMRDGLTTLFVSTDGTPARTIYDAPTERFVVALIVSYDVETAEEAAAACLDLTRDAASEGTHWYVYDRLTGAGRILEQSEFQDVCIL